MIKQSQQHASNAATATTRIGLEEKGEDDDEAKGDGYSKLFTRQ